MDDVTIPAPPSATKLGPFTVSAEERALYEKESETIEIVRHRIKGNPNCRRSGCYGRGYTGIIATRHSSSKVDAPAVALKIMLCDCAEVGKGAFAALEDLLDKRAADIKTLQSAYAIELDRRIEIAFRHTFFGGIKTLWRAAIRLSVRIAKASWQLIAKRFARKSGTVTVTTFGENLP